MARVVFRSGSLNEVLKSPALAGMLQEKAFAVASAAKAIAPVDTGAYRDSIKVVVDEHPSRVVAHVTATARHAHLVEADFGTLAKALGSA